MLLRIIKMMDLFLGNVWKGLGDVKDWEIELIRSRFI